MPFLNRNQVVRGRKSDMVYLPSPPPYSEFYSREGVMFFKVKKLNNKEVNYYIVMKLFLKSILCADKQTASPAHNAILACGRAKSRCAIITVKK